MSQVINTNALSLVAQNNLNKSQSTLGTAIERLSSGLRINSAKDDAAGQAISNRFTSSINGLTQASRNANDGISIAQTTEGALNEINDNLQNIRRLTVQANNGTNSDTDRQSIQEEIDARLSEIDRISDQTEFNGVKVLKDDQSLTIQVGANDGQTIDIDLSKMNAQTLGMDTFTVATGNIVDPTKLSDVDATGTVSVSTGETYDLSSFTDGAATAVDTFKPTDIATDDAGDVYVTDGKDYAKVDVAKGTYDSSATVAASTLTGATVVTGQDMMADQAVDLSGITDGSTLQTDGEGGYYLKHEDGSLTKASFDSDGTKAVASDSGTKVTAMTDADAKKLEDTKIAMVDAAIAQVTTLRSGLGAVQNRFNSVISNTNTTVTNLSESRSRILDADFASEVSEMSRSNILQSAGTTVLAQANQVPQNVLSLLR